MFYFIVFICYIYNFLLFLDDPGMESTLSDEAIDSTFRNDPSNVEDLRRSMMDDLVKLHQHFKIGLEMVDDAIEKLALC